VRRSGFFLAKKAVPERTVLQAVVHSVQIGDDRGVNREERVLNHGPYGTTPHLALLPRADVCQSKARVGDAVQAAGLRWDRAQEDVEAAPGRVGQWICQAELSEFAGEDPAVRDLVRGGAPVVQSEPSAARGEALAEAVRRGAAKVFARAWDEARVDQDGLQRSAGRMGPRSKRGRPSRTERL
jgi:hypothetical protein